MKGGPNARNGGRKQGALLEDYFGLIEAGFVFALAVGFYIWQRLDLRRYEQQDREKKKKTRDEPNAHQ